ncbi:MAG: MATE family efflux transporter [Eubacterium sp.]
MDQMEMRKRPVMGLLISMGIPMIISMIASSLYNIVDSMFVSMISQDAMTALSLIFPLQNVMFSVAVGFGVGINAVCAQLLGAERQDQAGRACSEGLWFSILHGIIITIVCLLASRPFLQMYHPGKLIVSYGMEYAKIVFLFSTAETVQVAWQKIFQSAGWMVTSMAAMLYGAVLNVILDPLMIFGIGPFPKMGISGAALATGLSQTFSMVYYLIVYRRKKFPVRVRMFPVRFSAERAKSMYAVGTAASLNMLLPSFMLSGLNAVLASFSSVYIFVLGIYYKLQNFLYMASSGLIQGMRPVMAYNYGAGEKKRVWEIYRCALKLTLLIMAFGTAVCLLFPGQLMSLFSAGAEAKSIGTEALRIICIGFLPSAVSVVASGCLEALGKGAESFSVSFLRYFAVILPCAAVLCKIIGAAGVWHAFWIAEVVTAFFAWGVFRRSYSHLDWTHAGRGTGSESPCREDFAGKN